MNFTRFCKWLWKSYEYNNASLFFCLGLLVTLLRDLADITRDIFLSL